MTKRLKGFQLAATTVNGKRALKTSFQQELYATPEMSMAYTNLWRVERDNGKATFLFRKSALRAMGIVSLRTVGQVRKHYEKNIEQVEVQFHEMMRSCGAGAKDYALTPVWDGD